MLQKNKLCDSSNVVYGQLQQLDIYTHERHLMVWLMSSPFFFIREPALNMTMPNRVFNALVVGLEDTKNVFFIANKVYFSLCTEESIDWHLE